MRLIAVMLLLIGTACGAEPVTNSKTKFHPTQIEVVGAKAFAPEQIEHELSWQSGVIEKSYENSEVSVVADYLREIVAAAYRQKGFLDVSVNVTLTTENRFRIQIDEGSQYQRGEIEIVGAKELDARRLTEWLQNTIPESVANVVLEVDGKGLPVLSRLPNGELHRAEAANPLKKATTDTPKTGAAKTRKAPPNNSPQSPFTPQFQQPVTAPESLADQPTSQEPRVVPAVPQAPLWTPKTTYTGDANPHDALKQWLPIGLARLGFHRAQFQIELVPDRSSSTVKLRVLIDSEGPPAQIADIQLRGNKRNSHVLILSYLDLKAGQRIDAERVAELEQRLAISGRFLVHRITVAPPTEDDRSTVYIDLREASGVPPLDEELSADQQLLLQAALWFNRWKTSGEDLVLEWRRPTGPSSTDASKDQELPHERQQLSTKIIAGRDSVLRMVNLMNGDQAQLQAAAMSGGGDTTFWNAKRQLRGTIDQQFVFIQRFRLESVPVNPKGNRCVENDHWQLRNRKLDEAQLEFYLEPSLMITAPDTEIRELGNDLVEFSNTDWRGGEATATLVVHRPSGRPQWIRIKTNDAVFEVSLRANALRDELRQTQEQSVAFQEVAPGSFKLGAAAEMALRDVALPYYDVPVLTSEQNAAFKSWLSTFDLNAINRELQANLYAGPREQLFVTFPYQAIQGVVLGQINQYTTDMRTPDILHLWLSAAQLASSFTGADPVATDSAAAELARFETTHLAFKAVVQSVNQRVSLSKSVFQRVTHGRGFGPLTAWAAANSFQCRMLGLRNQFAVLGLARLERFHEELDLLLAPGSTTGAVAVVLLDQLRALTPEARELLPQVLQIPEQPANQLKLLWPLLDSMKSKPTREMLAVLLDQYWKTSLRQSLIESLENAALEGVPLEKQYLALLSCPKQHTERPDSKQLRFWLERAEQRFNTALTAQKMKRGQQTHIEEFELEGQIVLGCFHGALHQREGNFEASRDACLSCIALAEKRLADLGEGPNVDPFVGSLTRRGKVVSQLATIYMALSATEWDLSGRSQAIQALTRAEQLIATLSEANGIENENADAAMPLSHRSRYWSYPDKDGSRDAKQALALAQKALEIGGMEHVDALDAYACALAVAGRFTEADTVILKATKLATGDKVRFVNARQKMLSSRKPPIPIDDEVIQVVLAEEGNATRQ